MCRRERRKGTRRLEGAGRDDDDDGEGDDEDRGLYDEEEEKEREEKEERERTTTAGYARRRRRRSHMRMFGRFLCARLLAARSNEQASEGAWGRGAREGRNHG